MVLQKETVEMAKLFGIKENEATQLGKHIMMYLY